MAQPVEEAAAGAEVAADIDLREALEEANLPTLLMVLAHLTGDDRWISEPYLPTALKGPGDHNSGGFPEEVQREIREQAYEIVTAVREGRLQEAPPPAPEKIERMLRISLGDVDLPEGFGPMLAEELGLESRDVEIPSAPPAGEFSVAVIGTGFSGILAAIKLQEAGIAHTVIEKNDAVGGTWLENTYPGCGVDTPTHLYSLSFAQSPEWSRYFAKRDEIHSYLQRVAEEHEIHSNIRFSTEVSSATWDEDAQLWRLELRGPDGEAETMTANAIISGVGFLNRPSVPELPGLENFEGPKFHTARWPDGLEIEGKRVAVIGTGASSMQLVPKIAGVAERVMVFQRTAQWGIPHPNYMRETTPGERHLMREVPHYLSWYRLRQLWNFGDRLHAHVLWDADWPHPERSISAVNESQRAYLTDYIREQLGERADELMDKCVPDYPPYGKRPLLDNGWFATVARDDVDLITEDIQEIKAHSIVTADGEEHPVDVLVLATGFHALRLLAPMKIRGRSGKEIHEVWGEDNATAYLGITVPDFPNMFIMLGPNTFAGHGGSGVLSIELEVRYAMEMLKKMIEGDIASVDVKPEIHDDYNARLDEALSHTIWAHPGMTTYYRNSKGRIVVPMPWTNVEYWHMTREPKLDEYRLVQRD